MKKQGLTREQVANQIEAGNVNVIPDKSSKTTKDIIKENLLTYFNGIFLLLAILVVVAGSLRSLTFLPVVVANVIIGIVQQLRSKKVLDDLSLLDKNKYTVIRDGQETTVASDELVLGDLVYLEAGSQIPADGFVEEGFIEVNESMLTGEQDEIQKQKGQELLSGSYVVTGSCYMTLNRVGEQSYAATLMEKAKKIIDKKSEMICDIEWIVKIAGILIIPIGTVLFIQGMAHGNGFQEAILSAIGAVIGMIPEGMYLLTTITLALSAMRLAQNHVLLHDMRSIETLARVDVLCVDKTGTITNSEMTVKEVFYPADMEEDEGDSYKLLLNRYVQTITDNNLTMVALRKEFVGTEKLDSIKEEPFSSKTKYSRIETKEATYLLGAPDVLLGSEVMQANESAIKERTSQGMRVIVFAEEAKESGECIPLAFISLENEVRKNANEIFEYFTTQGVEVKVISGDHPQTVSTVAMKAGIPNADSYIDATQLTEEAHYLEAIKKYTVFGRVKPEQKKLLVNAIKAQGKKVAMTGDGVNDILAMKEADCSIAMGNGSDAARQAAQVVLMDSDFSHLEKIVSEGRRNINNITRSATLFLYKNIFSVFMAVFTIVQAFTYPLQPAQVSLISTFNIGIPSFLLALEPNEKKQQGRFITRTLLQSLPAALTSFFAIGSLTYFAELFSLPESDIGTASTYLLAVVGYIILYQLCCPLNTYRICIFVGCILGFFICNFYFNDLFALNNLSVRCVVLTILYALAEVTVMKALTDIFARVQDMVMHHEEAEE